MNYSKKHILYIIFLLVNFLSIATTYTTIANGDWETDDGSVWDANGAPPTTLVVGDNVIINHEISISSDITIQGDVQINASGQLTGTKGIKEMSGTFNNAGIISIKEIKDVDGSFTNTGTITLTDEFKFTTSTSSWTFTNTGTITAKKFKDDGKGYPDGSENPITTFLNSGTITGTDEVKFDGDFTNSGTINSAKIHVDGDICNTGTITVDEAHIHGGEVSCGGTFTLTDCSKEIKLEDGDQTDDPSFSGQNFCCDDAGTPTTPVFDFKGDFNDGTDIDGGTIDSSSVSICDVPLPVKISKFSGKIHQNIVLLKWVTIQEINNSHFEIEKSIDGFHFISIGIVQGMGTTNNETTYYFDDYDLTQKAYYRLKQIDIDGHFSYSKIIHISSYFIESEISVFPNPANESFSILGNTKIQYLTIIDIYGNEYYSSTDIDISNGFELNRSNLNMPLGIYFIHFKNDNDVLIKRLIIK